MRHSTKIIAILDTVVAFFHENMDEVIYAHPPKEAEPDHTVVWFLLKAHGRFVARCSFDESEVRETVAVRPNVHRQSWEFER